MILDLILFFKLSALFLIIIGCFIDPLTKQSNKYFLTGFLLDFEWKNGHYGLLFLIS